MTRTGGVSVGLASLARGLFSAATAAIAVICRYAAFVITDSAFLTGLLDTAYTLAFAGAAYWLASGRAPMSARTSIVVGGLVSAAATAVVGLLTPLREYVWLVLLLLVIGVVTGLNYPAWYSLLRGGREVNELREWIGTYESVRIGAILVGTAGSGLVAHQLGLEATMVLVASVFAAVGLLALAFPRQRVGDPSQPEHTEPPPVHFDVAIHRRIRLLLGLLAAMQLMVAPIIAVTPVLAVEGVDGGIAHVGVLFALFSAGAALQFVAMNAVARGVRAPVLVAITVALMLGSAVLAAVWDTVVSAGLLMASFGFGVASIGTLVNAEIQTSLPEALRDQYVSKYALIAAIPFAVGSGLWGLTADFVPVPNIAVVSTVLIAAALLLVWRWVRGRGVDYGGPSMRN
ncbi:MFS transporter [Mycobacterium decipiens]|nr:MFS transporter [Mycobacterium decipiens]